MKWFDAWFERKFHYVIDRKANEIAYGNYVNSAQEAFEIAVKKQEKKFKRGIKRCRRLFRKEINAEIRKGCKATSFTLWDDNFQVLQKSVDTVIQEMTAMGYKFDKPRFYNKDYDSDPGEYRVDIRVSWEPPKKVDTPAEGTIPISEEIAAAVDKRKYNRIYY